jgi:hypothetical protein
MSISNYLCTVIGESPAEMAKMHKSTVKRAKTFAIAIHLPVVMWLVTGFVIASQVFELPLGASMCISAFFGILIFLLERVVLSMPKGIMINIIRFAIGIVIALLGSSAVDLTLFGKEIASQVIKNNLEQVKTETDKAVELKTQEVAVRKAEWIRVQNEANCEANGKCGSGLRSLGPVYQQLAKQADMLRQEWEKGQNQLEIVEQRRLEVLQAAAIDKHVFASAGLLTRVQALHQYIEGNNYAFFLWALLFLLVLFFEMVVVLSKAVFGDTVDDRIDEIRENVSHHRANAFRESFTSPSAHAHSLLSTPC